jgi:nitrate reductase gamma subunit
MSNFLHFAEHTLQEVALVFMATVYFLRIRWFLKWNLAKERQPATGRGDTNPKKGSRYSLANILMPWVMESTRTKPFLYIQFVLFHLGVVASIALSFIIPYSPGLLESPNLVLLLRILIGSAFVVGIMRIIRRVSNKYVRAISSPDDYFSLILLTVWFAFAFLAAPNDLSRGEGIMLVYFIMTAFFLIYVPFSKISHYLYYPFTRVYMGRHFGRRGVFPIRRKPAYQIYR